ncbi:MAG: biotin--[acetyl-CoA-carboxylase] ligase, partial [Proteobacteria bacterium]|nr:biotin--[acetyl-CoA-carboxylase] ligase [Pseudomonadota bacterium]
MKIFRFAELDSSSSHAARLLKAAEASPFAVIAKTQTAGRGRSGKSWMSPEGGLYLTLVLDSKLLGPEKLASLPLLVAIATSLWIWQRFGVRLTIKWPNDLLYAASKLGGILCESSVQDGVWGPSIIGLGLNLYAAPELSDQRSISLKQILGREELGDAVQLAEELANFLHESLFRPSLLQEFENFALEAGQVWVDDQQHFVQLQGLNTFGHLMVKGLEDGQERSLSSVRHEFQWIYQAQQEFPLVLADIGNTLTKIAIFRQARRDRDPAVLLRFNLSDSKENISRVLAKLRAENLPAA